MIVTETEMSLCSEPWLVFVYTFSEFST